MESLRWRGESGVSGVGDEVEYSTRSIENMYLPERRFLNELVQEVSSDTIISEQEDSLTIVVFKYRVVDKGILVLSSPALNVGFSPYILSFYGMVC